MPATAPFSLVASASAPEAPYPADTKAKGWRFELDYERIEQSDTWVLAAADMRPWLLMLWMTSWRQVPCGSLPATDELIAARLGMEIRQFRANRDILLRGWWLADDGRLYHPVITEQVISKLAERQSGVYRRFWSAVVARHGCACVYCGLSVDMTLDHVIPRSRGGSDSVDNLVPACRSCNSSKGARTPDEWRPK